MEVSLCTLNLLLELGLISQWRDKLKCPKQLWSCFLLELPSLSWAAFTQESYPCYAFLLTTEIELGLPIPFYMLLTILLLSTSNCSVELSVKSAFNLKGFLLNKLEFNFYFTSKLNESLPSHLWGGDEKFLARLRREYKIISFWLFGQILKSEWGQELFTTSHTGSDRNISHISCSEIPPT